MKMIEENQSMPNVYESVANELFLNLRLATEMLRPIFTDQWSEIEMASNRRDAEAAMQGYLRIRYASIIAFCAEQARELIGDKPYSCSFTVKTRVDIFTCVITDEVSGKACELLFHTDASFNRESVEVEEYKRAIGLTPFSDTVRDYIRTGLAHLESELPR